MTECTEERARFMVLQRQFKYRKGDDTKSQIVAFFETLDDAKAMFDKLDGEVAIVTARSGKLIQSK